MRAGENVASLDVSGMFVRGFHQFAGSGRDCNDTRAHLMIVRGFHQFAGSGFAGFGFAGFDFAVEAVPVVGKRYSRLTLELALQPFGRFIALLVFGMTYAIE
jgi:hypothetical protein